MLDFKKITVFEDKNLIILNKPIGVLSQKDGSNSENLEDELFAYFENKKVFLINRLDKDTSGLICFAKNPKTADIFSKIFANHEQIEKTYLTLVGGEIKESGKIDAPIRKNFQLHKMVVAPLKSGAKEALTLYNPVKNFSNCTLLEVNILTGRTHQIRVHMSYIRHHVIGDYKYGDFKINNEFKSKYELTSQFLHSYKLKFKELDKEFSYLNNKEFVAELPEKFKNILNILS